MTRLAWEVDVTMDLGGGTSDGEVSMVFAAQRVAEVEIAAAAEELDAVGKQIPDGDYGEAAALVASTLAACAEASAQLVTEAKVLALGVRVASGEMAATDAEQAVDFVEIGR